VNIFRKRQSNCEPADVASTPISQAAVRRPVTVCGQVVRIKTRPAAGLPSLVVSIADDSGTATAVWSGRRDIGGVSLGRRIILEGVGAPTAGGPVFMNPAYTLLADH
jgi:hypothetical protein